MSLNRRNFLQTAAVLGLTAAVPVSGRLMAAGRSFHPLPIPPLLEGELRDGKKHFRLEARTGQREFLPGLVTPTIGFNGDYLGPTLRMKRGDEVAIEVVNRLPETTTVHWHGMILPARMDGGPHQPIAPGDRWNSQYRVRQPAATLFYHAHTHGQTGPQVYRGLAGLLYIDDEEAAALDLPSDYGIDDIPLVLQDRDFDSGGRFRYLSFMPERMIGKHGRTLLVNGVTSPRLQAQTTLLRLRLVNASNARFYRLAFSDGRSFRVIASDGGLLPRAVSRKELVMAPAERYEILVDLSDRRELSLLDLGGVGNAAHGPMGMMGMASGFDVLRIDAGSARKSDRKPVQRLAELPLVDDAVGDLQQRSLVLQMGMMGGGMMGGSGKSMGGGMMRRGMMGGPGGMMRGGGMGGMMRINGKSFDMQRVDFRVPANREEIWVLGNDSPMSHPFHVHNTQFRLLTRNGKAVPAVEAGYKDTVVVQPGEELRIWLPTGPYVDERHPYMFHCHILEHEDGGMMGQFTVV